MAIKMRHNGKEDAICCNCNCTQYDALDMFDLCIGRSIFTVCDMCNSEILYKTVKAEVYKNSRLKSGHDIAIINGRKRKERNINKMEKSK